MKIRPRIHLPLLIALLFVLFLITYIEIYQRLDYRERFIGRKGRLVSATETPAGITSDYARHDFELVDDRDLTVTGTIKSPSTGYPPYPVLLMLGGLRTGKAVVDYTENTREVILVALDYPYEGNKGDQSIREFLPKVPAMREAMLNTIPAVMLTVDYLRGLEEVDRDRIILVGGSFGALFCPAVAASEPRVNAVAMLFAAGDLQRLIYVNTEVTRPLAALAAWLGYPLVSPVEPLKYIGRISPRPLLMINGTGDPRMPLECCVALHERAGEPKKIRWVDTGHLHVRSKEFHELLRGELVVWLDENGLIDRRCFLPDSLLETPR